MLRSGVCERDVMLCFHNLINSNITYCTKGHPGLVNMLEEFSDWHYNKELCGAFVIPGLNNCTLKQLSTASL